MKKLVSVFILSILVSCVQEKKAASFNTEIPAAEREPAQEQPVYAADCKELKIEDAQKLIGLIEDIYADHIHKKSDEENHYCVIKSFLEKVKVVAGNTEAYDKLLKVLEKAGQKKNYFLTAPTSGALVQSSSHIQGHFVDAELECSTSGDDKLQELEKLLDELLNDVENFKC